MKLFTIHNICSAALAAVMLSMAGAAGAQVVKRDHRDPPIVRDHRAPKPEMPPVEGTNKRDHRDRVVRDHRGVEGRVRPQRSSGTICAGWAC